MAHDLVMSLMVDHVSEVSSLIVHCDIDCLKMWCFMSRSCLSLDTCMSCLDSVLSFHVSSCLMSHDCVLTMSLSGIAKCLFCVETLAFLAESRPLDPLTCCLLTYCKMVILMGVVLLWL